MREIKICINLNCCFLKNCLRIKLIRQYIKRLNLKQQIFYITILLSVLDIRHFSVVLYIIGNTFMLQLNFLLKLSGAKKSCKDSQVSTRLFDRFPPNLFYDMEIHSGQLRVTHISDAFTCYNMLNYLVSQLPELWITYNVKLPKSWKNIRAVLNKRNKMERGENERKITFS